MDCNTSLVDRCKQGDSEAWDEFFEKYDPYISRYALFICNSREMAEDIAQDTRIKIYRFLGTFNGKSALTTWIYFIVRNTAYTYMRRASKYNIQIDTDEIWNTEEPGKILPEALIQQDDTLENLIRQEDNCRVRNAVQNLKERYRTVLEMRYEDDKTYDEIGHLLNIPSGTVKSRIYRSKGMLAAEMKN
jgi:RNA polymerase sigma-70 factor (ECF subfamily)